MAMLEVNYKLETNNQGARRETARYLRRLADDLEAGRAFAFNLRLESSNPFKGLIEIEIPKDYLSTQQQGEP